MDMFRLVVHKFKIAQRNIERDMLGVSPRDRIRNHVIRELTEVTEIAHRISTLKYEWAGHISRRTDNRWGKRVLEWRPRLGKRSVGRPRPGGVTICAGRLEMDASSRRSSEMARNWRGLCPAVDCNGLMMMMMFQLDRVRTDNS
jgi:hypothetical protein